MFSARRHVLLCANICSLGSGARRTRPRHLCGVFSYHRGFVVCEPRLGSQSVFSRSDDTIFAPASSSAAAAGVCVLRVSGKDAHVAISALGGSQKRLPRSRRATMWRLYAPSAVGGLRVGELLDHCVILKFDAPHSYTGENVVELHLHGGKATLRGVMDSLASLPRFRVAEAGEFTARAYEKGRMDLVEVEALSDLLSAETHAQRRQALALLGGALGDLCASWRGALLSVAAYVEAAIDFEEAEHDVTKSALSLAREKAAAVQSEVLRTIQEADAGIRVRDGLEVVFLGPPNVGKSSLLNAISKTDTAIVSPVAGTTRDVVRVNSALFRGHVVSLADTAGLRSTPDMDAAEAEGVRRALATARKADVCVCVLACGADIARQLETPGLLDVLKEGKGKVLLVYNKSDLIDSGDVWRELLAAESALLCEGIVPHASCSSSATSVGVQKLEELLARTMGDADGASTCASAAVPSDTALVARRRHRDELSQCAAALKAFDRACNDDGIECAAEELRCALRCLGRIVGQVGSEDVLDTLFREFCIGK